MSKRVSYQPIPKLAASDSAWAWTVSDGTFIIGRFNSKEYADLFSDALQAQQPVPVSVYECEHGYFGGCSQDGLPPAPKGSTT